MVDEELLTFLGEGWGEDASELLDRESQSIEAAVVSQSGSEDLTETGSFDLREARETVIHQTSANTAYPLLVGRPLTLDSLCKQVSGTGPGRPPSYCRRSFSCSVSETFGSGEGGFAAA